MDVVRFEMLTPYRCFYINLPIGGITIAVLTFFLKLPPPDSADAKAPLMEKIKRLDPLGQLFFLPSIICLLLALQWGGSTYPWSNWRIILLLVFFAVLVIAFITVQILNPVNATIPPRIITNRSIALGAFYMICVGSTMMVTVYYLPIWFQAIKGDSAVDSGLATLPYVLSLVVAAISAGIVTGKIGYYVPAMITSSTIMPIGLGLVTTFTPSTGHAKWIGYQVLFGFGLGLGMQQSSLAAQASLPRKDVPVGASMMFFGQTTGGAVFISVAQNILSNKLVDGLASVGLDGAQVVGTGATQLRNIVKPEDLPKVLEVYNWALVNCFYAALGMASISICGAVFMPWISVKKDLPMKKKDEEKAVKESEAKA